MDPVVEAALAYAARGWPVFPCWGVIDSHCACGVRTCDDIGKHPLGLAAPNGFQDATLDPSVITRWWQRWDRANVAIATGFVSGLVVVDVDAHHDGDMTLAELERVHGPLPPTPRVHSPRGGVHYYFARPPADHVPCRVGLWPGIDIRADGGYVLAPPSVGLQGSYREEIGFELLD